MGIEDRLIRASDAKRAIEHFDPAFSYIIDNVPTAERTNGYWINTPPYIAPNGNYNKAQECSVCHAYYVSSGYTAYSNHPYCAECGSKMDGGK